MATNKRRLVKCCSTLRHIAFMNSCEGVLPEEMLVSELGLANSKCEKPELKYINHKIKMHHNFVDFKEAFEIFRDMCSGW